MRAAGIASWLAIPIYYITTAKATTCAAPPLNLRIRPVSIVPGTLSHGVPVSIGTPPQQIALTPSLQLDNTFIPRYTNSCVDDARAASYAHWKNQDRKIMCAELYGGGFNPDLSSTFYDTRTNEQVREDWFRREQYLDWHFVTESFSFTDYTEVYVEQNQMPSDKRDTTTRFMLPDEGIMFGNTGGSGLGLTPNSTLLKVLYEEGLLPSRSWSLTNESLCLGCIDEGVHAGNFQVLKPANRDKDGLPCVLQTKIEAINYHVNDGTGNKMLIEKSFIACVDPGVAFLMLPAETRERLPDVFGQDIKSTLDDYMVFKGPPTNGTGTLTFKLEGGLEFVMTLSGTGDVDTEENGEWRVPIGKGGWGGYGEEVPVLGKPFTDSLVLRWDEETQEYGIANLSPDRKEKTNIKPLGCDKFPSVKNSVKSTPYTGVIIGCILGGFIGGLLFAAAGVFAFRKGRKSVNGKYEPMRGNDSLSLYHFPVDERVQDSRTSGVLSLPTASLRKSVQSHFRARSVSPILEPQLAGGNEVFEAPEGRAT